MVKLKIPAVISETGGSEKREVRGSTVRDVLENYAKEQSAELRDKVMDGDEIKEYINVYVNGKDVRNLQGVNTEVRGDDEIRIIPAASGGFLSS